MALADVAASVDQSGAPATVRSRLSEIWKVFDRPPDREVFELTAAMTLILLFLYVDNFWYLRIPIVVIAVAGILVRPLVTNSDYWFAVSVFLACSAYQNWYSIDNHKYLLLYWCIALCTSAASSEPLKTLRLNAKWLIGLAFAFAFLWKLISVDFLGYSFFYENLLTESRFETLAKWIGGVPEGEFIATADALDKLRDPDHPVLAAKIYESARLLAFARFMTWWTVILEGAIALGFLLPDRFRLSRLRDPALLVFLLTTYTAATVVGFGWVLAIMGYAQTGSEARWTRRCYLLAFALIFIYAGPWSDFFTSVASKLTFGAG